MAGILKNQILKLLSKFAKNVSPTSLNVSALKGEGELYNLELNEKVLTELLELPSWMQISHASVNKVALKIQWTKLKGTPIQMFLDEVNISMETCSELRPPDISQDFGSYKSGGKYGFSDKVIDGMTVTVNAVYIKFRSASFVASLQLSRITLCSKSPVWQKTDLRLTRLKDPHQHNLLIFKELSWQTMKIEARSTKSDLIPVRLITGMSCCRITIKKKLSDCSVIGCRLALIMEDIMWVLTDSQLLASYHFINSLSDLIKKATEESQKVKAARKLESIPSYQPQYSQNLGDHGIGAQNYPVSKDDASKGSFWNAPSPAQIQYKLQVFKKFDVVETSYHLFSEKIELHFLDDSGPGRSSYPELKDGAILQVSLTKAKIDYYPYHLATGDRTHWIKYEEGSPYQWTKYALNQFKSKLFESFSAKSTMHMPLGRASPHARSNSLQSQTTASSILAEMEFVKEGVPTIPTKTFVSNQFRKLMSTCCIVSCHNIVVYGVLPSKSKAKPKEIFSGEKSRLLMPTSVPFIQLEVSYYFYPGGFSFPVPSPKIYMHICPLQVTFDMKTLLWLNAFACHLIKRINAKKSNPPYLDIHIEAIMPRVIIEPVLGSITTMGSSRNIMQAQVSRAIISNVRERDPTSPGSKSSLFTCLEAAQVGEFFFGSEFPSKADEFQAIPSKFLDHALGNDLLQSQSAVEAKFQPPYDNLQSDSLWTETRDVLFFYFDPVWVEFVGPPNSKGRPMCFIDSFPLSIWLYVKELSFIPPSIASSPISTNPSNTEKTLKCASLTTNSHRESCPQLPQEASLHMLAHTPGLVSVQLNHQHYVLILRVLDTIAEFTTFLTQDTKDILGTDEDESFLLAAIFPQIDVSFLLSSQTLPEDSILTGLMQQMGCNDMFSSQQVSEKYIPDDSFRNASNADLSEISKQGIETGSVDALSHAQIEVSAYSGTLPSITHECSSPCDGRADSTSPSVCTSDVASCASNVCNSGGHSMQDQTSPIKSLRPEAQMSCRIDETEPAGVLVNVPNSDNSTPITPSNFNLSYPNKLDGTTPNNLPQDKKNYGFLYVKKGLTTGINAIMNTFDAGAKSPDDDAMSTHSDMSNESDNFVMLYMNDKQPSESVGGETLFCVGDKDDFAVDSADEVVEGSSYVQTDASSQIMKDMVSVMTLQLVKVHTVYEGQGHDSTLKMQLSSINCEELTDVSYPEFQVSFHAKSRNWTSLSSKGHPCSIKIRLETTTSKTNSSAASVNQSTDEFLKCSNQSTCISQPNSSITSQNNSVPPGNKPKVIPNNTSANHNKSEDPVKYHRHTSVESEPNLSAPTSPVLSENFKMLTAARAETPGYLDGRYSTKLPISRLSNVVCELSNVHLPILTTSIASLLDLVEDDLLPLPLPFKVKLEDFEVQLREEKKLLGLPSPISYKVSFPQLVILRDVDFNVTFLPSFSAWQNECPSSNVSSPRVLYSESQISSLKQELDEAKNRLREAEEENKNLMKVLRIIQGDCS